MRRKYVRVASTAAFAALAMVAVAGCQDAGSNNAGDGEKCGGKIAIFGAFTGPNAGLVLPSLNAAKLAVKQHNEKNPDCKVELVEFDTQGNPDQATPVANQVTQDQSFIAVIGGHFSGETKATMDVYEAAGLVMIAPSATAPELTQAGNKAFHRVVGNDLTQGAAAATYIKTVLNGQKVFVIDDATVYGEGIAGETVKNLGDALVAARDQVQTGQSNFDATISKIKSAQADVVVYAGYTNEAAPLLRQMRASGVTAKFIGFDGIYSQDFASGAGAGGEGAIITCPCLPASEAGGTFAQDYEKEYGELPGTYGAEGYDAATVLLEGIAAGKNTRAELLEWVDSYDKQGVSKYIKFDEGGDVDRSKVVIWAYEVKGGQIVPQQEISLS